MAVITHKSALRRLIRMKAVFTDWPIRFMFTSGMIIPLIQPDSWAYNVGAISQIYAASLCTIWGVLGVVLRWNQHERSNFWSYYLHATSVGLACMSAYFIFIQHNYFPLPGILGLIWATDATTSMHQVFSQLRYSMKTCASPHQKTTKNDVWNI